MSERTPEEILKLLEEQGLEDEMREVASMSDRELDDELRKSGIAPRTVSDAVRSLRSLQDEVHAKPVSEHKRPRSHYVAWTAIAAVAAVAFALLIRPHDERVGAGNPGARQAAKLRDEAYAACDRAAWAPCEAKLDEAKRLDPAGDTAPEVRAARRAAYIGQHRDEFDAMPERVP
jgi:hypothetical protein